VAPKSIETIKGLLAERDFRLLVSAQFAAQAADGFAQAAIAEELVLDPSGTPGRILSLFALTLLPYSLIAPFLGVFVDRWARRGLLTWTNVLRGAVLISIPVLGHLVGGDIELYAAVLILLGLGRLFLTTKGASLPAVVHERDLLQANAVSGGGGMLSALGGGVAGVISAGGLGLSASIIVAGVIYVAAGLIAARISDPLRHRHEHAKSFGMAVRDVVEDLGHGLTAIVREARARLPLVGIFLLRTIGMIVAIGAILVILEQYPDAGDRFGRLSASALALGTAGLGAFVGAVTAPFVGSRLNKAQLILLGFVVSGIGIMALGGVFDIRAVLLLTFVGGYGGFVTKVAVDAQLQEALPDEMRGRAFAVYDILYNFASVVAATVIVTAESVSLRVVLLTAGVLALAIGAVLAKAMATAGMLAATPAPADI
jgi:MFS family permease